MSRIPKKSPLQRLSTFQTFITDTDPNSVYFKLSEVPEQLTSGKNGFLIEGSVYLKPSTEIKIEILDVEGNPIYVEPGQGIPEYYEGLSKLISTHVYETTPIGIGKITILGEAETYIDDTGIIKSVPDEWKGIYNVKWEREVKINKNLPNTTRVRFTKRPTVIIEETGESFYSKTVTSATQNNGTLRGFPITPLEGTYLNNWNGGIKYAVQTEGFNFVDNINSITITGTPIQNAKIIEYVNQNTILLNVANTGSTGNVESFSGKSYTASYDYVSSIAESSNFGSFARFEINNLSTFVGDVERLKVYAKSRATSQDYTLLQDTRIDASDLLVTVISGSTQNLGYFTGSYANNTSYTNYWTTQSGATISLDSNSVYKGVKFRNTTIKTNLGNDIRLEKGSEYSVNFYAFYSCSNSVFPTDRLDIFLTSTQRSSSFTSNYYVTQSIATIYGGNLYTFPQKLSYNFIATETDNWSLNFTAYNDSTNPVTTYWNIGSVTLKGSNELGYSPDEFTFTIPINRQLEIETFDFKFEYYDINNNFVPITDTATQTFVSGNLTLLGKNLAVDADKYFFTFDQNSSAVPVSQVISINANKTNLAGNLLITSQAFDSGGVYLPPASFLGTPYPGKLTVATETLYVLSASLNVTQFTGSLHSSPPGPSSVIVDRVLYTFTETNSTQPQTRRLSISRVLTNAGTGSAGAAGRDAKTVNLTSNIYAIPYNSDGGEIGSNNIWLTASQQNHQGTVYYEFLKNDVTKQNSTSQYLYVSQSDKPNTGSRDSWKVNTREGSTGSAVVAYDTLDIFGLKDGVNGYTVFFTNGATTFPADDGGVVSTTDLLAGVTDVIFYRGTSSFTYDQSSPYDTNSYRTGSVTSSANITYSSSIVNSQLRVTPSTVTTNGGTILTGSIIVPLIDNSTSLTFNLTYAYSVTKAGKSGSHAVSIILDPPTQTVTYRTNQSLYGSSSVFNVRVLETGSALYYTSSITNLTTGSFTLLFPSGNGTNTSVDRVISASIIPPQPTAITGATSSFAVVYVDSKGNRSNAVSASHKVNVVSDGLSGSNAISVVLSPSAQIVSKSIAGTYSSPVTFSIQVLETGSALRYTGSSATLQNSYFTIFLPSGNGTLVPATASLSASIIPPVVSVDNGSSSSFAIQYRDSKGALSAYVSASHIVSVVKDGASGANGVTIRLTPEVQSISASLETGLYESVNTCSIQVFETGSALRYTGSNNTLQSGYFTIFLPAGNGTLVPATASLSASLIPVSATTASGSISNFAIQYRDSKGTLSQYVSASAIVNVVYSGVTGPGIVFTGPWSGSYFYQYNASGATGRRDVVFETSSQFYYATLQSHTANGSNKPTGTTSDNAYWQFLGSASLFVAAKIAIFQDSYVQNTLNVGTNNNGSFSSANITIEGGTLYPYIAVGQSSVGYGNTGVWLGNNSGSYSLSLVGASNFLKWDGTQLLVSGNISASRGNIGGVKISNNTLYTGTGTYANSNTPFYLASASTNIFSLGDRLSWNGSSLNIEGNIQFGSSGIGSMNITPMKWKYFPSQSGWSGIASSAYSSSIYRINGTVNENAISYSIDPFGRRSLVWESYSDGAFNADGGYYTNIFDIDNTKAYKFVTYFKRRTTLGAGCGTAYFGFFGRDTTSGDPYPGDFVYDLDNVSTDNPYFFASNPPVLDRWYLGIGYVFPYNYTGSSSNYYGGVYDCETGQKISDCSDYKWGSTNIGATLRTFLYYNTAAAAAPYRDVYMEMWGSAVYQIDGSEPDVNQLLDKGAIIAAGSASFGGTSTFIDGTTVYAPIIAGNTGYFSNTFSVGTAGQGIKLDGVNKKIYIGAGTFGNSNTPFYVASGSTTTFSLGNMLTFSGSNLFISGTITSYAGNIGGWSIGTGSLSAGDTVLSSSGEVTVYIPSSSIKAVEVSNNPLNILLYNISASSAASTITTADVTSAGFGIGAWTVTMPVDKLATNVGAVPTVSVSNAPVLKKLLYLNLRPRRTSPGTVTYTLTPSTGTISNSNIIVTPTIYVVYTLYVNGVSIGTKTYTVGTLSKTSATQYQTTYTDLSTSDDYVFDLTSSPVTSGSYVSMSVAVSASGLIGVTGSGAAGGNVSFNTSTVDTDYIRGILTSIRGYDTISSIGPNGLGTGNKYGLAVLGEAAISASGGGTYPSNKTYLYVEGDVKIVGGNYYGDGLVITSDRDDKFDITDADLGLNFIETLQPKKYKYKTGDSNRTHYGLIADEVLTAITDMSMSSADYAGYVKTPQGKEGLRYESFISPLIKSVQELSEKVKLLQTEITELKQTGSQNP